MRTDQLLRLRVLLPSLILALTAPAPAFAARLLHAEVEVDGKVQLRTLYQDDGTLTRGQLWRLWQQSPIDTEPPTTVTPAPSDPLRAQLRGVVVLRIKHTTQTLVEVRVSELELIRDVPGSPRWHLSAEEMTRIGLAGGVLEPMSAAFTGSDLRFWMLVASGVLLVAGAAFVLVRRRRMLR